MAIDRRGAAGCRAASEFRAGAAHALLRIGERIQKDILKEKRAEYSARIEELKGSGIFFKFLRVQGGR